MEEVFSTPIGSMQMSISVEEDEEALKKTILETYAENENNQGDYNREVDVRKLGIHERQQFIDKHFKVAEEDNEKFFRKFRNRIDRVGINLPTVEVRFEHLTIETDCYIGDRALPTLLNAARNIAES
ncbi:hypothetical protein KY284_010229 [Solanum tuberosum]|nr:hypothetical protein KY284_010229 [Solanum tuberosum]